MLQLRFYHNFEPVGRHCWLIKIQRQWIGATYILLKMQMVCLPLLLSTRFHRNGIQHFSLEQPLYKKVHTLLGDLKQNIIIIITNIIVITILQKVRVSFMFRDHYRPNPFLPQLRASYFHPRILFSSFACL